VGRRRVGRARRKSGRGRDSFDEYGRRRDARRLRHRADAGHQRGGLDPRHRFGRRGPARTFLRGADRGRCECRARGLALPLRRVHGRRGQKLSARAGSRGAMSLNPSATNFKPEDVRFDERGLVPAIVQDARTREVLTLAYMNEESLRRTLTEGETWFWSRSRAELWHKGATSGPTPRVLDVRLDCDSDALVVLVEPRGPACHTGARSCFGGEAEEFDEGIGVALEELYRVVSDRRREMPEGSYTTY